MALGIGEIVGEPNTASLAFDPLSTLLPVVPQPIISTSPSPKIWNTRHPEDPEKIYCLLALNLSIQMVLEAPVRKACYCSIFSPIHSYKVNSREPLSIMECTSSRCTYSYTPPWLVLSNFTRPPRRVYISQSVSSHLLKHFLP